MRGPQSTMSGRVVSKLPSRRRRWRKHMLDRWTRRRKGGRSVSFYRFLRLLFRFFDNCMPHCYCYRFNKKRYLHDMISSMAMICPDSETQIQTDATLSISADVNFACNKFPKYKIGANNEILDEDQGIYCSSLEDIVSREEVHLSEQKNRLSVRDIASRFNNNFAIASKLADETEIIKVASLEGHVILKNLSDALEVLRSHLTGEDKDGIQNTLYMVETLAVKLTQGEGELLQEKFQLKKMAAFVKQATEDAINLINQEKSFVCAEIESARAVVHKFGESVAQREMSSHPFRKQDLEELVEIVQEGRRTQRMHQPIKVMNMELELRELRIQVQQKSSVSFKLQKEIETVRNRTGKIPRLYKLDGSENLGSCLRIQPCSDKSPETSTCSFQWYRSSTDCRKRQIISGADESSYAPEPLDVGQMLEVDVTWDGQKKISLITSSPITFGVDVGSYVDTLTGNPNVDFNVVVSQMNGKGFPSRSGGHVFHVGRTRMKLCRGWITKSRESYSSYMQLFGVRGGGGAAARSMVWQSRKGVSFVMAFKSECERNAAIIIARKCASCCDVTLVGPGDDMVTTV